MNRYVALSTGMYLNRAASATKRNFLPRRAAFRFKKEQRARRDKRVSSSDSIRPAREREFLLPDIRVGSIGPHRHVSPHFVGATHRRQPVATIQIPVPIKK